MIMPKISIIIPTFNSAKYIEECLSSALNQTYKNIELIVTDNYSQDSTVSIARYYSNYDNRISIYQNSRNIGPVMNWLAGIKIATGDYIKLLFSDDILSLDCIDNQLELLSTGLDICFSSACIGVTPWQGERHYQISEGCQEISAQRFLLQAMHSPLSLPCSPCAYIFNGQLYKNIIFNLVNNLSNDEVMMQTGAGIDLLSVLFCVSASKKKVGYIYQPQVYFRAHQNSITIANNQLVQETLRRAREIFIASC